MVSFLLCSFRKVQDKVLAGRNINGKFSYPWPCIYRFIVTRIYVQHSFSKTITTNGSAAQVRGNFANRTVVFWNRQESVNICPWQIIKLSSNQINNFCPSCPLIFYCLRPPLKIGGIFVTTLSNTTWHPEKKAFPKRTYAAMCSETLLKT